MLLPNDVFHALRAHSRGERCGGGEGADTSRTAGARAHLGDEMGVEAAANDTTPARP